MQRKRILTLIIVLGILIVSFFLMRLFLGMKKAPEVRLPEETVRKVTTQIVTYSDIPFSVTSSGRLLSGNIVDLGSEVSGKIEEGDIRLKKGSHFIKDQVIARIFDKEMVLSLKARKSRFMNTLASILPEIKIDFPEYYKNWQLFFNEISLSSPMPEIPGIDNNSLKIFLSGRNILSEYYGILADEVRLEKYTIRAPFEGDVVEVYMEPGAIANPGTKLARIIRTTHLELEVPLESRFAGWIEKGNPVAVSSEDDLLYWEGRVVRKSSFVDTETQSVSIFISLPESARKQILPGQYLKARFKGKEIQSCMEIPRNAIFNNNVVFTVENGRLKKQEIEIVSFRDNVIIFRGLEEGAEVVVEPLLNASENTLVETNVLR